MPVVEVEVVILMVAAHQQVLVDQELQVYQEVTVDLMKAVMEQTVLLILEEEEAETALTIQHHLQVEDLEYVFFQCQLADILELLQEHILQEQMVVIHGLDGLQVQEHIQLNY
jgi:hypothetical protein